MTTGTLQHLPTSSPSSDRPTWPVDLVIITTTTVLATLITVAFTPRFYFVDDTQASTVGTWWTLGSRLRDGDLSFLDLTTWTSGNVLLEGQWGVFNPLVLLISVGATFAGDLALYALLVKMGLLSIGAVGAYFLGKALNTGRRTAVILGCLAPLTGFTTYMDAASWTTGLCAWCFFPWLWLSLVNLRRGVWGYLPAAGFLTAVVTVGYFHPCLMAAFLIGAFLLVEMWQRQWNSVRDFLLLGVVFLLIYIPVFAPAMLTASVTNRGSDGISNSGLWGPDASDLLTAASISPGVEITNWAGGTVPAPVFYIAWFLPVLLAGITLRWRARDIAVAALFGGFTLLVLTGPTEIGPLRFPARLLPYWCLAVLVAVVVGANDNQVQALKRLTGSKRFVALAWFPVLGTFIAFSDSPGLLLVHTACLVAVLGAIFAWWAVSRRSESFAAGVGAFVVLTLTLTGVSRWIAPDPPLTDFGSPAEVSQLQIPLSGLTGQTFVVGNMEGARLPQMWTSTSLSRNWAVNDVPVQNSYVVIGYQDYVVDLAMDYHGMTPGVTLDTLFSADPETDTLLVDLMGIQNLQLLRNSFEGRDLDSAPRGWKVSSRDDFSAVWTRTTEAPPQGEPTWTSPGVTAEVISNTADTVRLMIGNATQREGLVVLSRLDWPGYSLEGDVQFANAVRGYLLTLSVPAGAEATEVTVSFQPPGLLAGSATAAVAVLLLFVAESRRRRRLRAAPSL